jgi:competence protein ComEC
MPLVWLALGFALGLFLGASGAALLLGATAGGYLIVRGGGIPAASLALLVAGLLLGTLRAGPGVLEPPGDLAALHDRTIEVRGQVVGLPELAGTQVRFTLAVEEAREAGGDWREVSGTAIAWVGPDIEPLAGKGFPFFTHGDRVTLVGELAAPEPIGSFDYAEHLAARGVGSLLIRADVTEIEQAVAFDPLRALHSVRQRFSESIERQVPEPQAALTQAMLLGLRGDLAPQTNEDFRRAGLAHLLAVSGMHVGLLLGLALLLSQRLIGRHRAWYLVPPLLFLWLYILLTGAPASAVRAGLMGTAFLLALATGRANVPLNVLGLAAIAILATEPRTLWDRSFQLSFSAMAGVLLVGLRWRATWSSGWARSERVTATGNGTLGTRGAGLCRGSPYRRARSPGRLRWSRSTSASSPS